uniref:Neprosin domain-containing protein n=1 Tax=Aegilops tauschii subsp. strangulata TaxID=200361 RepID=A0A453QJL9_AEGTS
MAMQRFLTALVFCGTPLDAYSTVSTSVMTTGSVSKLVSGGTSKPTAHKVDAEKKHGYSGGPTLRRHAGFQLAFDGLNCFDAVPYE